ncbi:MAG: thioredoxin family protein [Bacteroidota bacterium]
MKKILILLLFSVATSSFAQTKYDDWEVAKKKAESSNKNILIILTGAEWCKPCVKMEKNVMQANEFIAYSNDNLILLEINLPRHWDYDSKVVKDYEYFKNNYQTNALPSLILVDMEGKEIMKITSGLTSLEKVMKQLRLHK